MAGPRMAAQALHKFYSPKLHKASPKAELSAGFSFYVNVGGDLATAAPTGIAGTNVARVQLVQADPAVESFTSKLENIHEGLMAFRRSLGPGRCSRQKEIAGGLGGKCPLARSLRSRTEEVQEVDEPHSTKTSLSVSLTESKE